MLSFNMAPTNIIPFPSQNATVTAAAETLAWLTDKPLPILPPVIESKRPRFHTAQEIRDILKAKGANASKVSVKVGSSLTYVTVTIRDHTVKAIVEAACKELHTWSMDNTDYVEGQSVHAEMSEAAKAAYRAPFMELAGTLHQGEELRDGQGREVAPGILLWHNRGYYYLATRYSTGNLEVRGSQIWAQDFVVGKDYSIERMAYWLAELTEVMAAQTAAKVA